MQLKEGVGWRSFGQGRMAMLNGSLGSWLQYIALCWGSSLSTAYMVAWRLLVWGYMGRLPSYDVNIGCGSLPHKLCLFFQPLAMSIYG